MFPELASALDALLRQHLLAAQRASVPESETGTETRHLCVGFVDLVDSTDLVQRLSMGELGSVLTQFENAATDVVTAVGGRAVKFIGDEVLYTAQDEAIGCRIALDLAAAFTDHTVVPPCRAGVASGEVMLRDGDVFGPAVNLAARAVKVGGPGEVVVPTDVAVAAGLPSHPLGSCMCVGSTWWSSAVPPPDRPSQMIDSLTSEGRSRWCRTTGTQTGIADSNGTGFHDP